MSHSRLPIGTFINMATVTVGSLLGLWLQQLFTEDLQLIVFQALGLGTLVLGIKMSLNIPDGYLLIFIFSLIVGGLLGETVHLDDALVGAGDSIKGWIGVEDSNFTDGLIAAVVLFCIGSMTIVGSIEEGLEGKRELLLIKSMLDGVASIAFASTYGIGVLFSIFPMLLIQGSITLMAGRLRPFFTPTLIAQLAAVGGALIIGIGVRILGWGEINIENLLPSLLIVVVLTAGYERYTSQ